MVYSEMLNIAFRKTTTTSVSAVTVSGIVRRSSSCRSSCSILADGCGGEILGTDAIHDHRYSSSAYTSTSSQQRIRRLSSSSTASTSVTTTTTPPSQVKCPTETTRPPSSRSLSSNAAVWEEETEEGEDGDDIDIDNDDGVPAYRMVDGISTVLVTPSHNQQPKITTTPSKRPRLEALRKRLQSETTMSRPTDFATAATAATTKSASKTNTARTRSSSSLKDEEEDEDQETNIEQLIRDLEQLPVPVEPLTDRFGRHHSYLRISLAERCNLRCLYCMPEDGVPLQPSEKLLSNDEVLQLATSFHTQGVNKIRLTGGEPLLRKDLVGLVSNLNRNLDLEQIGMTTNGVTLSKHLPDLVDAGLTHVNISLDSLDADKFARLTRRPASYHDRVMEAIEDCAKYLPHSTKINCVVMPDNVDELQAFSELTRSLPIDVRFIEYMPFNDNQWQTGGFVSYEQMQERIDGLERIQDGPNDTTKWWRLPSSPSSPFSPSSAPTLSTISTGRTPTTGLPMGRIGFITSMSEHFCGTCNRLRLTADGQLKVCLFGKTEVSLRDLMRQGGSEELLHKVIHYAVQRKHFKLGGHKDMEDLQAHSAENRPMTLIGG
mmetsp:Transcript_14438/g.34958  ORF Transcript_14438/g.34958 Transcript_14438/m.34958 type:complete len:603 (+) Transcript_14438:166-1974(+)